MIRNRGHTLSLFVFMVFALAFAIMLSGLTTQASANSAVDEQYQYYQNVVVAVTMSDAQGMGMPLAAERTGLTIENLATAPATVPNTDLALAGNNAPTANISGSTHIIGLVVVANTNDINCL